MTQVLLSVPNRRQDRQPGAKARAVIVATRLALGMAFMSGASAQQAQGLAYDAQTQSVVPIPPSERALQSTVAEPWFKVSKDGMILEGAIFDRSGNLLFCDVSGGRLMAFNRNGIPIGQVLLPGRDGGHNLASTSLAIDPNRNDLYAVANDGDGGQGATVFHAKVFSKGLPPVRSQ